MVQATAVVFDKDQTRRDDVRLRLVDCGVLPICFDDEWICLENIYHIRPAFAVMHPDSRETTIRFVSVARAIRTTLPVIVLSNRNEIGNFTCNTRLTNLFLLEYPVDQRQLQDVVGLLAQTGPNLDRPVLVAGSPESQKRIESLALFGKSEEPVLIQGERGVGKRLMARAICSCTTGGRVNLRFIRAGDISEAWIRAMHQRIDRPADSGETMDVQVIENIEALPVDLQSQLLPVMEYPAPKGRAETHRRSVRFISLAESDLERLGRQGRFRPDLYHRLSVFKMTVPPLRRRPDDVLALTYFFITRYSILKRRSISRLPDHVRTPLQNYNWPGNVPELKRAIEDALASRTAPWEECLAAWGRSRQEVFRDRRGPAIMEVRHDVQRLLDGSGELSLKTMKRRYAVQVETRILRAALSRTDGNCKKAAGMLKISYKSMLNKVKDYGLVGIGWMALMGWIGSIGLVT